MTTGVQVCYWLNLHCCTIIVRIDGWPTSSKYNRAALFSIGPVQLNNNNNNNHFRKGYLTASGNSGGGNVVPPELWAMPPQSSSMEPPPPFHSFDNSRLFTPHAPPPMLNVSSLQAQQQQPPIIVPGSGAVVASRVAAGESATHATKRWDTSGRSGRKGSAASMSVPVASLLDHNNTSQYEDGAENDDTAAAESALEAAKRKNLPAWIR